MTKQEFRKGIIYQGDCLEIMPQLIEEGIKADLCLTDPPYGINVKNMVSFNLSGKLVKGKKTSNRIYPEFTDHPPNENIFTLINRLSKIQIIWGGNYFTKHIPPSMGWIVWDKLNGATNFSDAELAYTNLSKGLRLFSFRWNGMLKDGDKIRNKRIHLTQKPYELFCFCISYAELKANSLIIDPFAGSGTTAIAAMNMGHRFILIEKEPAYFDLICKRIEAEEAQPSLFDQTA